MTCICIIPLFNSRNENAPISFSAAVEYENYNSDGSMVIDNMVVHQSVYLSRILPNPPEYYIRWMHTMHTNKYPRWLIPG